MPLHTSGVGRVSPSSARTHSDSVRLINMKTFLEREQLMSMGERVDRRIKTFKFRDNKSTKYAVLSHRWIDPTEGDYGEMADPASQRKMKFVVTSATGRYGTHVSERERCVDTCCIDKRSSAELLEEVGGHQFDLSVMWQRQGTLCVPTSIVAPFLLRKFPKSNGWPE